MTKSQMRWVIALLLFLATAVNYADRQALSIVSKTIRGEFGMTEVDYSRVVATFFLAYAIMYAGSGYIVDRLGTKKGFAFFISLWSLAAMSHALARGTWTFGICRFFLGLGEPGNWPAAAKAIQEWFPAKQRALGVGLFNAGSSLGSMVSPPLISWLTYQYGWKFAFVAVGAIGLVWLVFWLGIYYTPKPDADEPEEVLPRPKIDWAKLVLSHDCLAITFARTLTDPVIYFVIFWLPEYLQKERHFDLAMVGKYSWVPFLFGGIGYTLGGWLSGWLMERGVDMPVARKRIMLIGAACLPVAIAAPLVPTAALAIGATCFITFGHGFWVANLQTLPTDLFRRHEVGTVSGFSGMGGALAGAVANLGTGYVVQHFSYSPVFLLAGILHPMGMVIIWKMLPNERFRHSLR